MGDTLRRIGSKGDDHWSGGQLEVLELRNTYPLARRSGFCIDSDLVSIASCHSSLE